MIFTFEGTIKDSHGIEHTNPVFRIPHANFSCNTDIHYSANQEEGGESNSLYANYTVDMWTNQAAKDADFEPLKFTRKTRGQHINFNPSELVNTSEEVALMCRNHFLTEVLSEFIVADE